MHNIMRFIRQNKKQIIRIAVIAAFLFLILQILNYLTENNKNINVNNNKEQSVYEKLMGLLFQISRWYQEEKFLQVQCKV